MAIVSDTFETAFFVPPYPLCQQFKKFLFLLENPNNDIDRALRGLKGINNREGFKWQEYSQAIETVPQGYRKVALYLDPADVFALVWKQYANKWGMRRRGELDRIAEIGLDDRLSFAEFVSNLAFFKQISPMMQRAIHARETVLGSDPDYFDDLIRLDDPDGIRSHFGAVEVDPDLLSVLEFEFELPGEVMPGTWNDIIDHCRSDYDFLNGHHDVSGSASYKLSLETRQAPSKAIKLSRQDAEPDPDLHVVSMMKEAPEVVRQFVAFYKSIGFGTVHLYFDDPDDPSISVFSDDDRVVVNVCDDEFWHHRRKNSVEGRQVICFNHCYSKLDKGWLLVVDADEFIASDQPIPDLLRSCPPDQRAIRFHSTEAVWDAKNPGGGEFSADYSRALIDRQLWNTVRSTKDKDIHQLYRRGILSHRSGKQAIRAGLEMEKVYIHRAIFADGYDSMRVDPEYPSGTLVHFDAISETHWRRKVENRLRKGHGFSGLDPARNAQHDAYESGGSEGIGELFSKLYRLNEDEKSALAMHGSLYRLDLFEGL